MYKPFGFFFVFLATLGVFLPLLPTTPFVLVAAGCFAKSSPRCHAWLVNNKVFGPLLINWEEQRCVACKTKLLAVFSIIILGGASMWFAVNDPIIRLIGIGLLLIGLTTVIRLQTCPKREE